MKIGVEAQLSTEVKPQEHEAVHRMRKPSAKCEARVGQVGMVIWTTKHKCKAVKRMEGALGISMGHKNSGCG